jgi:tRNA A-37 threonylcarbamoyl transferase component Bud32
MSDTNTGKKCSRCGAALPADAPEGLCPRCLIGLNFAAQTEEVGPGGTIVIHPRPEPPPIEQIAKLFPQFEVLELLGRGGMGFVYKARQPRLNRLIALKILAPDPEKRGRFAERFEREAQALAKLTHPNIVTVYEFGETSGLYYLVMEFVDGVNLRNLIRSQTLKPEQALAIVPAICDALQYAHAIGIVHRDIKPENILLDKQGRVKIADFGIAKISGTERQEALTGEHAIGTPHYMAPEQIERPTEVDHRADIYSLGVVFYEMLTGELPLGKFALPSKMVQLDVRLDEVVLRALEKEPGRRYQQAGDVKTDVESITTSKGASSQAAAPAVPVRTTSDKIILPAFLLAFFFGVFGAHRFYVGKIGTGFAQLFTFGACGIWSTIDWILILCKAFTDSEGKRLTEWIDPDRATRPPPQAATAATGTSTGTATPAVARSDVQSKVKPAAIALVVVAGLKILSALTTGALLLGLNPLLKHIDALSEIPLLDEVVAETGSIASLVTFVPSVLVLIGGLKMLRYESRAWAMAAAILAMIFPPLHLIGIPVGIWALVILSQQDVRNVFGSAANTSATGGPASRLGTASKIAVASAITVAALAALTFSIANLKADEDIRQDFNFVVPLTADGRLSLDNVNGKIEITPCSSNAVVITGVKRGSDRAQVEAVQTEIDSKSDHVTVHTRIPKKKFGWKKEVKVDYSVQVPAGARLDNISSVNGKIVISGIGGDIAASTVNGAVQVNDARKNLKLSTVNGSIVADIKETRAEQSVSFDTVNGAVTVTLPAQPNVRAKGETLNGSITSDYPELTVKKDFPVGKHLNGSMGDGACALKVNTVNGSVTIKKAEAVRQ